MPHVYLRLILFGCIACTRFCVIKRLLSYGLAFGDGDLQLVRWAWIADAIFPANFHSLSEYACLL